MFRHFGMLMAFVMAFYYSLLLTPVASAVKQTHEVQAILDQITDIINGALNVTTTGVENDTAIDVDDDIIYTADQAKHLLFNAKRQYGILLTPNEEEHLKSVRFAETWPLTTIYYTLEDLGPEEGKIIEVALREWQRNTCLTFYLRDYPSIVGPFIAFARDIYEGQGQGCSTTVGYNKARGKHMVYLAEECFRNNAYTIYSKEPTILPRNSKQIHRMGQRIELSFNDVKTINFLYQCRFPQENCKRPPKCVNGGYQHPSYQPSNNCDNCICPLPVTSSTHYCSPWTAALPELHEIVKDRSYDKGNDWRTGGTHFYSKRCDPVITLELNMACTFNGICADYIEIKASYITTNNKTGDLSVPGDFYCNCNGTQNATFYTITVPRIQIPNQNLRETETFILYNFSGLYDGFVNITVTEPRYCDGMKPQLTEIGENVSDLRRHEAVVINSRVKSSVK